MGFICPRFGPYGSIPLGIFISEVVEALFSEFAVQHVDRWYGQPVGLSIPLSPNKLKSLPFHGNQSILHHVPQFTGEGTPVGIQIIRKFTP